MNRVYTGVGSRKTPGPILSFIHRLALDLAGDGWTLRSGGAEGADHAFEAGWWDFEMTCDRLKSVRQAEIYLPWDDFNYHTATSHDGANRLLSEMDNRYEAEEIAAAAHPAWGNCSPYERKLHTRNVYQVLGADLASPSDVLICWAPPCGKGVTGGTATAFRIAINNGVKCFNLARQKDLEEIATLHSIPLPKTPRFLASHRLFADN